MWTLEGIESADRRDEECGMKEKREEMIDVVVGLDEPSKQAQRVEKGFLGDLQSFKVLFK